MEPVFYIEEKNKITKDALLRKAVETWGCCYDDLEYAVSDTGKPYFKNSDLQFSKSDTKNHIAVCVSDSEVGIDIEEKDRAVGIDRLIDRYFSDEERSYINAHTDKKYAFLRIWTRKEALLKANGIGLRVELKSLNTVPDIVNFYGICYRFLETVNIESVICSICIRNNLLD